MNKRSTFNLDGVDLSYVKVLVTGASGYIGRNLVDRLIELRCQVSIITRNRDSYNHAYKALGLIEFDLSNEHQSVPDLSGFDVIFNCAGELKDPKKMQGLHVDGTMRLLKSLQNRDTRWVQLSSVGVYGQNVFGEVTEDHPFCPDGPYEVTKAEADTKVRGYCLKNDIPFSILRPSNVFSLDMTNKSLEKWIGLIHSGWFFESNKAETVHSNYVHINNVVDALVLCGFHEQTVNQDFIVSDFITQTKFVKIVCDTLGITPRQSKYPYLAILKVTKWVSRLTRNSVIERKICALNTSVVYSNDKLFHYTDYTNRVSLEQGIRDYVMSLSEQSGKLK
ncbi:NAD(P)-dependent oxidoreductase [Vibrio sp. YMD68]|uniref:NAD-dependent epimerase/dehydratase family protein n=1 Tax=Vibrio sp. YMD68 TaxID=3042300 RepID=UPI002499FC82|nr:NAD(P)-dependent oxidoreductase [Vibrio sp. YMD68]WGW00523.1 NAD(P)-dependent oxidoreductase [Vibrio sp. YMD68]